MKQIPLITAFLLSGILSTGCVDEDRDKHGDPGAEEMDLVITIHTPPHYNHPCPHRSRRNPDCHLRCDRIPG